MDEWKSSHELAETCIYTALIQLMTQQDYQDITITDIAKKAGVSRMTYYRNYQSKEEILTRHLDKLFQTTLQNLRTRSDWSEHDFWEFFFAAFKDDPSIALMIKANLFDLVLNCHERYAHDIFAEFFHWSFDTEEERILFLYNLGGITRMIRYTIEHGGQVNQEAVIKIVEHCFTRKL